jgi:hypothetical protein
MAKAAVRKRISTIQVGRTFDTLSGSSEDRLQKLMNDTGVGAEKLISKRSAGGVMDFWGDRWLTAADSGRSVASRAAA